MDLLDDASSNLDKYAKSLLDMDMAFRAAFQNMTTMATDLNKQFTQGRERITEMNYALAQSGPTLVRLGGDITDAFTVMENISKATRRNVIASVEDVTKLYAAEKLIGGGIESIVGDFQDVGVQFSQVGKQLEQSINYVRGVGANAGQVMRTVMGYMDQMNKFNFSEGVLGLTKMATQASLLRYDMSQTLSLAEGAMNPERAIELASAFQRLGVSAGDLVDPFQLMNKSINDPQGLQNSIIDVAKQFSYFDEKTKTFKISPQGILMLKEIEKETQLSAKEMSKLAVNAADLDRKLSSLSPTIEFKNPEDKMYLANIAKMGEGGDYEVTINDKETRKLGEITQSELNRLIEEQKKPPKSLEDLTRDQVDTGRLLQKDVQAIRDKFVYGVTSAEIIRKELEGLRRVTTTATGTVSENFDQKKFTDKVDTLMERMGSVVGQLMRGDPKSDELKKELEKLATEVGGYLPDLNEFQQKTLSDIVNKVQPGTIFEKGLLDYVLKPMEQNIAKLDKAMGGTKTATAGAKPTGIESGKMTDGNRTLTETIQSTSQNITIGGSGTPITFKLEVPPGVNKEYIEKLMNSATFSESITKMVLDRLKEMELIK